MIYPPGEFKFSAIIIWEMVLVVSPYTFSLCGSTVICTCCSCPPLTLTDATPSIRSRRGAMVSSTILLISSKLRSPLTPIVIIGRLLISSFKIETSCASSGSIILANSSASRISLVAVSKLVPYSNITITTELPAELIEVMLFIPEMPAIDASSGFVTRSSTSSGPAPS